MQTLFIKEKLDDRIISQQKAMITEIQNIECDRLFKEDEQDLINSIVKKYYINIPKIDVDRMKIITTKDRTKKKIKVTEFTFTIPFEGDSEYFNYQARTSIHNPPKGEVVGKMLHMKGELSTDQYKQIIKKSNTKPYQIEQLLKIIIRDIDCVVELLSFSKSDIFPINRELPLLVKNEIDKRKKYFIKNKSLLEQLDIIDFSDYPLGQKLKKDCKNDFSNNVKKTLKDNKSNMKAKKQDDSTSQISKDKINHQTEESMLILSESNNVNKKEKARLIGTGRFHGVDMKIGARQLFFIYNLFYSDNEKTIENKKYIVVSEDVMIEKYREWVCDGNLKFSGSDSNTPELRLSKIWRTFVNQMNKDKRIINLFKAIRYGENSEKHYTIKIRKNQKQTLLSGISHLFKNQ